VVVGAGVALDTAVATTNPHPSGATAKVPTWKKVGLALISTLCALVLAELIATWAMGGAYPYLNIYAADSVLGVRLQPEASTTVESPLGRTTEVETNALGFRGAAFGESPGAGQVLSQSRPHPQRPTRESPGAGQVLSQSRPHPQRPTRESPGAARVLIVGDSQVMAYGVAEPDGFVSRLGRGDKGRDVMGAGIPTWGPAEYTLVARELVERFRPAVLVVVINAVNDWNEADFPNVGRTAERDGWAVGLTPGQVVHPVTDFPLRHFLMSRSHLVLAWRLMVHGNPHERAIAPAWTFVSQAAALNRAKAPWRSKLGPHLAAIHALCLRAGCRVLTVALPDDVMVDTREWAKYLRPDADGAGAVPAPTSPTDLTAVAALMQGLATDALTLHERAMRRVGGGSPQEMLGQIPGYLDLTRALVAASPGAFLPDDFHLSERGHEAVAKALEPALETLLGLPAPETPDQDLPL